jgi:DNA-binding NtrC family response regulator
MVKSMNAASTVGCLIAEDQALIGMSLEACLADAGYEPLGPFATNSEALRSLEAAVPNVALSDVLLKDSPCTPLLHQLCLRGVLFAIYSGIKPTTVPPEFADAPWLEKPVA